MVGTESDTAYGAPPLSGAHTRRGVPARCDQPLYAEPHATTVTCQACGATYEVAERRAAMLRDLDPLLMTKAEIARTLEAFHDLPFERVHQLLRTWQHRGRITPNTTLRGKPAYVCGEVSRMVLDTMQSEGAVA